MPRRPRTSSSWSQLVDKANKQIHYLMSVSEGVLKVESPCSSSICKAKSSKSATGILFMVKLHCHPNSSSKKVKYKITERIICSAFQMKKMLMSVFLMEMFLKDIVDDRMSKKNLFIANKYLTSSRPLWSAGFHVGWPGSSHIHFPSA